MNPMEQIMKYFMNNSQAMQNPIFKNAMQMFRSGNMSGIEQIAKNLCKERRLNPDDIFNQIKEKMNL